jgi:hypothetical protein
MQVRMLSVAWMQRCKDKNIVTLTCRLAGASAPGSFLLEKLTHASEIDNDLSMLMGSSLHSEIHRAEGAHFKFEDADLVKLTGSAIQPQRTTLTFVI